MAAGNASLAMPPYLLDDDYPLLMPRWGYVASAFVLFLIGFMGFFLNLMVILLMFKDRQLWTPLNMILFNLVCSDFCVSLLGNPLTLISALFHRWVFGNTMCVLYGFFMALLGITSITTLTVLSFERYMMVTRPLTSRHLSTRGACLIVLCIWLYSLALTTPPLFAWGSYVREAANISCSVNWHEQSTNSLTYILFLFAMGQILPMSVITFSYVNIVRTIRQNSQRMGRVGRAETKVTAMVFVMIVAFSVAWTPYSVFALVEQFGRSGTISPGAGVIPALVAKSSICYDPIIYIGMNTQFRQAIRRLFGNHSKRGVSLTERGYDNTVLSPAHRYSRAADASRTEPGALRRHLDVADHLTVIDCREEDARRAGPEPRSGDTASDEDSGRSPDPAAAPAAGLESRSLLHEEGLQSQVEYDVNEKYENVYCNRAFDKEPMDLSEVWNVVYRKSIHHSYSMDVVRVPRERRRKLSAETRLDRLAEQGSRTFLCQVHMLPDHDQRFKQ